MRWKNTPVLTLIATLFLVADATVLVLTGHMNDTLFSAFVLQSLPVLIAAGYSERTGRDVRNGVVKDTVKAGAHEALTEAGVTQVAAAAIASQPATTDALARLVNALDNHNDRLTNVATDVKSVLDNQATVATTLEQKEATP